MKYFSLLCALGLVGSLSAVNAAKVPDMRGMGMPSIGVEATWNDTLDFEDGDGGLDLAGIRFDTPLAVRRNEDDVYLLKLKYGWTNFDLNPGLGEVDLHSVDLVGRWAHFPKERGWIAMVDVVAGVGTDFSGFNGDAWQFSTLAFWGYQTNPRFSWAVAGYASYALGDFQAYPSIGIVWTPDEFWRVQLTPPLAIVSYRPNQNWRFGVTFLPNGGSWQFEERDGKEQIDLSLWTAAASVERRLAEKLFVSLRGGVNLAGEVELRNGNEEVQLDRDLDPGLFLSLGLSWEF